MTELKPIRISCMSGASANRSVLLGFAPANVLHLLSFADILDEDTGRGYQRRFNPQHSLDFRRYIQGRRSSTIPLTFNLRPRTDDAWKVFKGVGGQSILEIDSQKGKVLAQVDCQHRLGHLNDLPISLPFMCFIGLSEREEMEVFNVINGKARGLSTSLLDFHDAQLSNDVARDRPELLIALCLNNEIQSPWHRQLDLGGTSTSGLTRRASLRTMQKATKRFLNKSKILRVHSAETTAGIVRDFWTAISLVLSDAWSKPRKHLLTKGIGVYALMDVAAELVAAALSRDVVPDRTFFMNALSEFALDIDWSTDGPMKGLGGEGGVKAAIEMLHAARRGGGMRIVSNGQ